jgi:hypothetical protein
MEDAVRVDHEMRRAFQCEKRRASLARKPSAKSILDAATALRRRQALRDEVAAPEGRRRGPLRDAGGGLAHEEHFVQWGHVHELRPVQRFGHEQPGRRFPGDHVGSRRPQEAWGIDESLMTVLELHWPSGIERATVPASQPGLSTTSSAHHLPGHVSSGRHRHRRRPVPGPVVGDGRGARSGVGPWCGGR